MSHAVRFALALVAAAFVRPVTPAQELVRPLSPAVRMTRMTVQASIVDGVASTTLHQTWRNDGAAEAEAIWVLPLPPGAVADGFTLTINGVPTAGEVLGADAARGVYEGIVRRKRDPGLLEFFGRGCLRARIFPIPARGEVAVDVGFRALCAERLGVRSWSFALRAAGAEGVAPERIVLDLTLRSKKPIKNVFAPLAGVQVIQKDDHEARASFEGTPAQLAGASGELAVYYGLSEAEFGLDLLTHRAADDAEGTFLMLLSPKRDWQGETLAKSIAFVLDTSGSMEGAKIQQAKNALRLFLQSLSPNDRFDVVPFSTEAMPFFGARVPASPDKVAEALARTDRIVAAGGTNIEGALAAALTGQAELDGRVSIVVFLTDGEPTVGVTDPKAIRDSVRAASGGKTRLFVLGVGDELNTLLLDALAAENGGARDYVRQEERIDEKARALFAKLSHPVMTDLVLTIDGLAPTQLVPAKLPDLFAGDRIELFGRYAGEGAHAIRLAGTVGGVRRELVYEGTFPRATSGDTAFLAPLWAERRVAVLLDAIRLNGANTELVREVERLGKAYRIVTPYTSHLVVEPGMRPVASAGGPSTGWRRDDADLLQALGYAGEGGTYRGPGDGVPPAVLDGVARELADDGLLPTDAPAAELAALTQKAAEELRASERRLLDLGANASGADAVEDSVYLAQMSAGHGGPSAARTLVELLTRRVQDKTFVLASGVWVDQACAAVLPAVRTRVAAFSAEYFALLAAKPALAPYFAIGERVVVQLEGETFEAF